MPTRSRLFALLLPLALCVAPIACDGGDDDGSKPEDSEDGDTDSSTEGGSEEGTAEAGDGDPGDGDPGDGDGDPGMAGDGPAQAACQAFEGATPTPLIAAASAGDAATASIVPDGTTVYAVTLPEGAAGFVQLQIADWNTTQAFFTNVEIEYTITTDANAQEEGPRELDAACPEAGITDQRVTFPHWTPALIEFSATGPREILLMVVQVS